MYQRTFADCCIITVGGCWRILSSSALRRAFSAASADSTSPCLGPLSPTVTAQRDSFTVLPKKTLTSIRAIHSPLFFFSRSLLSSLCLLISLILVFNAFSIFSMTYTIEKWTATMPTNTLKSVKWWCCSLHLFLLFHCGFQSCHLCQAIVVLL